MTDPSSDRKAELPAVLRLSIPDHVVRDLPEAVRAEIARLPPHGQAAFAHDFQKRSKSLLMAYVCSLIYCHYLLLDRGTISGFMLLSLFNAAALGMIWWLIDVVRMPSLVRDYNGRVAREALRNVKIIARHPGQFAHS